MTLGARQMNEHSLTERASCKFGVEIMHASVWAILITVVLFGVLNLIDFKRLD